MILHNVYHGYESPLETFPFSFFIQCLRHGSIQWTAGTPFCYVQSTATLQIPDTETLLGVNYNDIPTMLLSPSM